MEVNQFTNVESCSYSIQSCTAEGERTRCLKRITGAIEGRPYLLLSPIISNALVSFALHLILRIIHASAALTDARILLAWKDTSGKWWPG